MRSRRHAVDRGAAIPDVGARSDQTGAVSDRVAEESCELCEAARVTEWYHEDDVCWVAECEACFVPMVVWKRHDPNPPEEVRVVFSHASNMVDGPQKSNTKKIQKIS